MLPQYNPDVSLEDALSQFDCATSRLVLLPRGRNKIRQHVFDAATDAAIASNRCVEVFEKESKKNEINPMLSKRFLDDITISIQTLKRLDEIYDLLETIESEPNESDRLKYERNIVISYISLMALRAYHVRDIINNYFKDD